MVRPRRCFPEHVLRIVGRICHPLVIYKCSISCSTPDRKYRDMSSPFSHTPDASNQHIPACLSSGSMQLGIIDGGTYAPKRNFPFVEPTLQHSSSVVEHLFTRNPLLSVGDMMKRFEQYCLDSDPHLYVHRWGLFVKTINVDGIGNEINTYAQIADDMLFLSIPEYLLNSDCLIICTNNVEHQTLNAMGRVLSGLVTRQYLVNSANITSASKVSCSRKEVVESIRSLDFAHHYPEYSTNHRMKLIAMCENRLANARRLYDLYASEASKHGQTEALTHGQRRPDFM